MRKRCNRQLVCRVTAEGVMVYPVKRPKPEKKPHIFIFGRMTTIKKSELPEYKYFNIFWL